MEEMQDVTTQDICKDPEKRIFKSVKAFVEKRKVLLLIIAAVVVFATIAGIILFSLSPEQIAIKYAEADFFGDYAKMNKYKAYDYCAYLMGEQDEEEFFEACSDRYEEDIYNWKDLSSVRREQKEEALSDVYGDYKITVEASRSKDMSVRKFKNENERVLMLLEDDGLFDVDDVDDVRIVTVKGKIDGEDGVDRITRDVIMVRMGLLWKAFAIGF